MNIEIITNYDDFLLMEKEWERLFDKTGTNNIFLSWEWSKIWIKHHPGDWELMIVVVRDHDEVIGIAPLMKEKGGALNFGRSVIRFLGDELLTDYTDFLVLRNNVKVVQMMISHIISQKDWSLIKLVRVPENSSNYDGMVKTIKECGFLYADRKKDISTYIDVNGTWDDYLGTRSRKFKKSFHNSWNRLSKIGEISFEQVQA